MNHRKFVITSTVLMFLVAGLVAGLALYSSFGVMAHIGDLPKAVSHMPMNCKAVFGINVQKFIASPVYAKFEEKHGAEFGSDLAEFTAKTGVDPRKDITYIVAGSRQLGANKGEGVIIAAGKFNTAAIKSFLNTKGTPIPVDYNGAQVLMIPEGDGSKLEKGVGFLGEDEIALGDLDSLKAVIDAKANPETLGIAKNDVLGQIINNLDPNEMFWFAGDATSLLDKAPTNTPFGANLSAIQYVVGTLNLSDAVAGKITVTAKDYDSAKKLADVARGFIALGQLATQQSTETAEFTQLLQGISIEQKEKSPDLTLTVNFPLDVLERLHNAKPALKAKKVV